jgi:hypothetical protein
MPIRELFQIGQQTQTFPESADFDARNGRIDWTAEDLRVSAYLENEDGGNLLGWSLFVGDAKFGPSLEGLGEMAVRIESTSGQKIPWPVVSDDDGRLKEFYGSGLLVAQKLIASREQLARFLICKSDVGRGQVKIWLNAANYPARLVEALLLARDLNDVELEQLVMAKINSGPLVFPDGDQIDVKADAGYWAKKYQKALGIQIPIE